MTTIKDKLTTELFKHTGAFFCFGQKQYDEQAKPNIKYVAMGGGMVCPKENAKELVEGIRKITDDAIKLDLKENTKAEIMWREFANHEAHIAGDLTSCTEALEGYGITPEEFKTEFAKYYAQCLVDDNF